MNNKSTYTLKQLPYRYYELEPYVSEQALRQHHIRHLGSYVRDLKLLLSKHGAFGAKTLYELYCSSHLFKNDEVGQKIRYTSGAVYAHNLYFSLLCPSYNDSFRVPRSELGDAIRDRFGSFERFSVLFRDTALSIEGSGWTWLCKNESGVPTIIKTQAQELPDIDRFSPVLVLDMWEHAYYLDYLAEKREYVHNYFRLINWELAQLFWCGKINYR